MGGGGLNSDTSPRVERGGCVTTTSEPVGGRSSMTDLPCFFSVISCALFLYTRY